MPAAVPAIPLLKAATFAAVARAGSAAKSGIKNGNIPPRCFTSICLLRLREPFFPANSLSAVALRFRRALSSLVTFTFPRMRLRQMSISVLMTSLGHNSRYLFLSLGVSLATRLNVGRFLSSRSMRNSLSLSTPLSLSLVVGGCRVTVTFQVDNVALVGWQDARPESEQL